jgi:hypothetical protein
MGNGKGEGEKEKRKGNGRDLTSLESKNLFLVLSIPSRDTLLENWVERSFRSAPDVASSHGVADNCDIP